MTNLNMVVEICGLKLQNPITTASGTFSIKDSGQYYDVSKLGALITKGVASEPWEGNGTPRIAEAYGGMINAVGLQNPGVDHFIANELPLLLKSGTKVIVNIAGKTVEEYCKTVEKLNETDIDMMELNISCPNIKEGGIGFGTDVKMAEKVTKAVRRVTSKPLIVKLTPNVTDITEIAKAVESQGADCVSLINTLLGMKIDVKRAKPVLKNTTGGLSGPAIKPVAVRMVYQVRQAVEIPIIGLGGIMTGEDVAEFIMAGADIVSVGTAALIDPVAPIRILEELEQFMILNDYNSIQEIREAFI